jgi:hypothetical protein
VVEAGTAAGAADRPAAQALAVLAVRSRSACSQWSWLEFSGDLAACQRAYAWREISSGLGAGLRGSSLFMGERASGARYIDACARLWAWSSCIWIVGRFLLAKAWISGSLAFSACFAKAFSVASWPETMSFR